MRKDEGIVEELVDSGSEQGLSARVEELLSFGQQ